MAKLMLALLTVSVLTSVTSAHVRMTWPYPFRSLSDPALPASEHYTDNPKQPLNVNGDAFPLFPCWNWHLLANNPNANVIKTIWTAGESYNMTLDGSAVHGGGSCQLSLSYDNGASFKVIQSMIGGCPVVQAYNFTIPNEAPASNSVLFAWTWQSFITAEMYMNCARVEIQAASSRQYRRAHSIREAPLNDLPDLFVCNIANGCKSGLSQDVEFPNPGPVVIRAPQLDVNPQFISGPGFSTDGSATIGSVSTTSSSATLSWTSYPNATTPARTSTMIGTAPIPSALSAIASTSSQLTSSTPYPSSTASAAVNVLSSSSTPMVQGGPSEAPSMPSATATPLSLSCTPGAFACNTVSSFSQCVPDGAGGGTYTYMGSVAVGMECVDGVIVRENAGACTPSGQLSCKGTNAFYLCDHGELIDMGPVAPGTMCVNGAIQRRRFRRR